MNIVKFQGFRYQTPYEHSKDTFCKQRWIGKPLLLVEQELGAPLLLNHQTVPKDTLLKDGDIVSSKWHQHEPPILDLEPQIVFESDDLLVVDKPCSFAVHPTGNTLYQSLTMTLSGYGKLYPVNRLDKPTSGLVFLARTPDKAKNMANELQESQKIYLARVLGVFPESLECTARLSTDHKAKTTVDVLGKHSLTHFKLLETNGTESIVECRPISGRTHQIRVHLQHLGFPITNDVHYGPKQKKVGFEEPAIYERANGCETCQHPKLWPEKEDLVLWLHCYKCVHPNWSYQSNPPDWSHLNP
ncbi:pseudouridine synthase [Gorgonomyces haynaldii]|nr:pseudouridine synthase [Gorgonomyces haynaldii]